MPGRRPAGLSASLAAPPGHAYRYSNLNFCLLGLLVEQVAGRPYEAVVDDRLLEPLGIEGMRLVGTFDPDPAEVVHPSVPARNYMEVLGAAGSWVATPSDIVTIVDSLDPTKPGWHPLSPPMLELMRQPLPAVPYPDAGRWYGLGLMVFGDGSFGHTGTVERTHAMVRRPPRRRHMVGARERREPVARPSDLQRHLRPLARRRRHLVRLNRRRIGEAGGGR